MLCYDLSNAWFEKIDKYDDFLRQKKLPIWWSDMEDADLLLGAHKHGHRDFDKIRSTNIVLSFWTVLSA